MSQNRDPLRPTQGSDRVHERQDRSRERHGDAKGDTRAKERVLRSSHGDSRGISPHSRGDQQRYRVDSPHKRGDRQNEYEVRRGRHSESDGLRYAQDSPNRSARYSPSSSSRDRPRHPSHDSPKMASRDLRSSSPRDHHARPQSRDRQHRSSREERRSSPQSATKDMSRDDRHRSSHDKPTTDVRTPKRQTSRTMSIQREDSTEETLHLLKGKYPAKYANKKVQESDGNFFESFTALAWKQENRRRRAQSEDEYEAKKPPPLETSIVPRSPARMSKADFEKLYVEVLYTIKHRIGATTGGHLPFMQDLYLYAREAFGVTPEDHARLLARASEEKPPILILEVTVVEARDLEAKDADGFSDPYCMLGIIPGAHVARQQERGMGSGDYSSDEDNIGNKPRREGTFRKFSQSFRKRKDNKTARDMIPARYIRTTSVKPNTLDPLWNEKFRFDLDDVQTDNLHLDIWDHDDEFSVVDAAKQLNQVQGFKGLGRYFKQIAQSARTNKKGNVDDFLGSVNFCLNDIPSTGIDDWFDLEGRSSRSNIEGQIHLKLQLATREDKGYSEEDNWNDIQEHEDLVCVFIEYELRKFKGEVYQWTGELSQAANTILHQHAIQGDITDVQQSMCRWRAYSRKHQQHPFDWSLLLRLLEDLDEKWEPASLNRDEEWCQATNSDELWPLSEQEECLASGFLEFIDYCLSLVYHQREAYPPANKAAQVRLQFMLRCLAKLYDMAVFRRCCPFQKELNLDIETALKKSNTDRYERQRKAVKSRSNKDEEVICGLINLTSHFTIDMKKALQHYNPLFKKYLNMEYFAIVYKTVEKLLGDDLNKDLEHVSFLLPECGDDGGGDGGDSFTAQMMGTQLFELYLCLNEFTALKEHLPHIDIKHVSISNYYEWYKVPVQRWLNMSKYKAMRRIKKAVDLDKVGEVEGTVKQSTSAVDVSCCFGQVIEFWKSMEWPNHLSGQVFVTKITADLCQGATYYADLMHDKLRAAGYYDEVGQFDVTEQLCRTINDIEQVRRALKPLPETLKYDAIVAAVEAEQGTRHAEKTRGYLYGTLHTADEGMVRKIKQVVDRVADKMRPDIKKFVFHLCWAPEKVPAEDAISDLMNYLDNNLLTLNNNLLRSNFDRILDSIWVEVLEEIQDVINKEEMKAFWFFARLVDALDILVEFFYANEKGLSMTVIQNELYTALHRQLSLNKATTPQLIEIFYAEKILEQEKCDSFEFGSISVRVYYKDDAEILSVEVLNARNVIPLDPNGLSDPFVLIELCPQHVFPKQNKQQTQIIKKTLNPTFDESFEFSVSAKQCRHTGACIQFTVMDHDLFMSNDFAGEAFLCLNDIPGISGEEISGFSALTPVSLTLLHPRRSSKASSNVALDALRIRDDDKVAQEFFKKRKAIESQSLSKD